MSGQVGAGEVGAGAAPRGSVDFVREDDRACAFETTARARRVAWLDAARGAGIPRVVFGHVWRGLFGPGPITHAALFHEVDRGIYLFLMPLFFLLAGISFRGLATRQTTLRLISRRGWRLLWPMVLRTYVTLGIQVLAVGGSRSVVTAAEFSGRRCRPIRISGSRGRCS